MALPAQRDQEKMLWRTRPTKYPKEFQAERRLAVSSVLRMERQPVGV